MADGKDPTLDATTKKYRRLIDLRNQRRVSELLQTRRKVNITTGFLFLLVVGIYGYTIKAIKQEKFLDDFEEPKVVPKPTEP